MYVRYGVAEVPYFLLEVEVDYVREILVGGGVVGVVECLVHV